MGKILILFVTVSLASCLVSLSKSKQSNNDDDDAMQRFTQVNMALTGKVLYNRLQSRPNESYTIVTLSLGCILGHIGLFADAQGYHKILKTLNLKNRDEMKKVLKSAVLFINETAETSKLTFKAFGGAKLTKNFKQSFIDVCNGDTGLIDFNDPDKALEEVDEWFANQTSYNTVTLENKNLFNCDDKDSVVYVTSLDYLYNLDNEKNPNGFRDIDFQVCKNKSLSFPSFYGKGFFKYAVLKDLDCLVLVISTNGDENIVVFYYPLKQDKLLELMKVLQDPEVFYGGIRRAKWMCLDIDITIGSADTANDLLEYLPELKFISSGLKGVLKSGEPAHVTHAIQQLHLFQAPEVRKGPLNSKRCPGNNYEYVKMNHPCAYYVLSSKGLCIYAGLLNGPQSYGL